MRFLYLDTLSGKKIDFAGSTVLCYFLVVLSHVVTRIHGKHFLLPPYSMDPYKQFIENVFSIKARNITCQTLQIRTILN